MEKKTEWEDFFDEHAKDYHQNVFTKGTDDEVKFLLDILNLPKGSKILDMGCGTCRHSIELAKHGYKMTGVDLSSRMLEVAKENADKEGVKLNLIKADATKVTLEPVYDGAICLCEGSFGLLNESDDPLYRDLNVLKNIAAALKPDSPFVMTALNAYRLIREAKQEDIKNNKLDPIHMIDKRTSEDEGLKLSRSYSLYEKHYVPSELIRLHIDAGFEVKHVWGGTAGNWKVEKEIDLDEYELMVISIRKAKLGSGSLVDYLK